MVDCKKNDELVLATIAAHEDKDPDQTGVEEQDSESGYDSDYARPPKRRRETLDDGMWDIGVDHLV